MTVGDIKQDTIHQYCLALMASSKEEQQLYVEEGRFDLRALRSCYPEEQAFCDKWSELFAQLQ